MIAESQPVAGEAALRTLQELLGQAGVRREVALRTSATVGAPVLYGLRRPTILLPEGWVESLSPEDLRALLAHEVAHVKRRDFLANFFQRLVEIPLFFHPGAWVASRRIALAREELADAWALGNGVDPDSYARSLTAAAERVRKPMGLASVGVVEGRSTLLRRVEAIMSTRSGRRVGVGPLVALGVLMLAASVALLAVEVGVAVGDGGNGGDETKEMNTPDADRGQKVAQLSAEFFATLVDDLQEKANAGEVVWAPDPLPDTQRSIALAWIRASDAVRPLSEAVKKAIEQRGADAIGGVKVMGDPPSIAPIVGIDKGILIMDFVRAPELGIEDIVGLLLRERDLIAQLCASLSPTQVTEARPVLIPAVADDKGGLAYESMTASQREMMVELDRMRCEMARAGDRDQRPGKPEEYRIFLWRDEPTGFPQGMLWFGNRGQDIGVECVEPHTTRRLRAEQAATSQEMWKSLSPRQRDEAGRRLAYSELTPTQEDLFLRVSELGVLIAGGPREQYLSGTGQNWYLEYDPAYEWVIPRHTRPALLFSVNTGGEWVPIDGQPWPRD
jgi:hypothetical protein